MSFLKTYFVEPDRSLEDVKACYPIFVTDDEEKKNNKRFENDNKYFVMYDEKLKTLEAIANRKYIHTFW